MTAQQKNRSLLVKLKMLQNNWISVGNAYQKETSSLFIFAGVVVVVCCAMPLSQQKTLSKWHKFAEMNSCGNLFTARVPFKTFWYKLLIMFWWEPFKFPAKHQIRIINDARPFERSIPVFHLTYPIIWIYCSPSANISIGYWEHRNGTHICWLNWLKRAREKWRIISTVCRLICRH